MKQAAAPSLWRTTQRLDEVGRLLLKPEPSGLGALVGVQKVLARAVCGGAQGARGWNCAGLAGGARRGASAGPRLAMLLDHARAMVGGWQMSSEGGYGVDGGAAPVRPANWRG